MSTDCWLENVKRHLEDIRIHGRTVLKWSLRLKGWSMGTELIWFKTGSIVYLCEYGSDSAGYLKGGEFVDWLSDYQLFKESHRVLSVILL